MDIVQSKILNQDILGTQSTTTASFTATYQKPSTATSTHSHIISASLSSKNSHSTKALSGSSCPQTSRIFIRSSSKITALSSQAMKSLIPPSVSSQTTKKEKASNVFKSTTTSVASTSKRSTTTAPSIAPYVPHFHTGLWFYQSAPASNVDIAQRNARKPIGHPDTNCHSIIDQNE